MPDALVVDHGPAHSLLLAIVRFVADDGGSLDGAEARLRGYVAEVSDQCRFALLAVSNLEQLLARDASLQRLRGRRFNEAHERFGFAPCHSPEADEHDAISKLLDLQGLGLFEFNRRLRFWIDAIVDHVTRIERLLWPTPTDRGRDRPFPTRGADVRELLRVGDAAVFVSEVRGLRSAWQHIDDRIDQRWAARSAASPELDDEESGTFEFSSNPLVVTAMGETVELEPVIDEVRVLLARCQLSDPMIDPQRVVFDRMNLEW